MNVNPDLIPDTQALSRLELAKNVDRLLALADRLPRRDRQLIRAVLVHQQNLGQLAELLGTDRFTVSRTYRRLLRRLLTRRFALADHFYRQLDDTEQQLAELWVFAALPLRQVAMLLDLSLHRVRKLTDALSAKLARLLVDPSAHRAAPPRRAV